MDPVKSSVVGQQVTKNANPSMNGMIYLCYFICIICIVAGTSLTLLAIWANMLGPVLAKLWGSIAAVFSGSLLTLLVTKTVK